jgi:hypothetical protein
MSRETEFYDQFGTISCSEPGDRPSISDADDATGFSGAEEEPAADGEDRPGIGDEESTGAAG